VLGQLIPLAVLSAITSPTAVAAVLVILTRQRAFALLTAYTVASVAASVAVGIAIVLLLGEAGTFDPKHGAEANHVLDVAMGLIILLSTAWIVSAKSARIRALALEKHEEHKARKAAKPHKPSRTAEMLAKGSVGAVAVLGVAMHMPGLMYLVALADIAHADLEVVEALIVLLIFNLIMLLPIELPLLAYGFRPEWTERTLKRMNAYVHTHERALLLWAAVIAGGYLIVAGVIGLLGGS